MSTVANQDRTTHSNTMLNVIYQLGIKQKVIHIGSNEALTQNQLVMGGVTHKFRYMLKPFNFINVG